MREKQRSSSLDGVVRGHGRAAAILVASFLLLSAPPAWAINEVCSSSFVSTDITDYGGYLSGNDVYMRYAAAEYLGSSNDSALFNYHVIAWVTDFDPITQQRKLKVAPVMDYPSLPNCIVRGKILLQDITDVNWVQHGGHLPAGQVGRTSYPSHGYLVWSDKGDDVNPPRVAVARFWMENGELRYERVYLERYFDPTHVSLWYPAGITPSMASNRPLPVNQDYNSDPYSYPWLACYLAQGAGPWAEYWAQRCDSHHRLLLVYSGDPRRLEPGKTGPEDPGCDWSDPSQDCNGWLGYTIRYKLFRPGDDGVLYEGTLADVRDLATHPNFDPVRDHAVYPEVTWNEASRQWVVMWEEQYKEPNAVPPGSYNHWKVRTVDEQGNLGPTTDLGVCWSPTTPTITNPGGDPDRPPPERIQKGYCYPLNLANDYYSLDGLNYAGDRNAGHFTFLQNYMVGHLSQNGHPYEWIDSESNPSGFPIIVGNPLGTAQVYNGESLPMNSGVIGLPVFDSPFWPYPDASYVRSSYEYDPAYGCTNVFYLLSHGPSVVHNEGVTPDQQHYRVDDAATWDQDCTSRAHWAVSSSVVGFVALWAQYVPSQAHYEMRFGSYTWLP